MKESPCGAGFQPAFKPGRLKTGPTGGFFHKLSVRRMDKVVRPARLGQLEDESRGGVGFGEILMPVATSGGFSYDELWKKEDD